MKKFVGIIMVMVMMTIMVSVSFAEESKWQKAYTDMCDYLDENDSLHRNDTTIDNTFYTWGTMDTERACEEFSIIESWDEKETWFVKWYTGKLMELYPEYGMIHVSMEKHAEYNESEIYHLVVSAENDLVEFKDGFQNKVDMMVVFY